MRRMKTKRKYREKRDTFFIKIKNKEYFSSVLFVNTLKHIKTKKMHKETKMTQRTNRMHKKK